MTNVLPSLPGPPSPWARRTITAALAIGAGLSGLAQSSRRIDIILPDKTRVSAEVAATEAEREQGLMNRRALNRDAGMLFIFDKPGPYEFWMKNTLIPLDMLWLDKTGKVVSLTADVPPCKADPCPTYPPSAIADYVLELEAGYAKSHGLKVGDTLTLKGLDPVRP
jgi:uncharacterized membrane protein (UPF0127 family)